MKRRIRQNIWGNWKGYEGTRKTQDFGTDGHEAQAWLTNGERTEIILSPIIRLRGPGPNINHDPRET